MSFSMEAIQEQRGMIADLVSSLTISNAPWNEWEFEFIESLEGKEYKNLSIKQQAIVEKLWEKL